MFACGIAEVRVFLALVVSLPLIHSKIFAENYYWGGYPVNTPYYGSPDEVCAEVSTHNLGGNLIRGSGYARTKQSEVRFLCDFHTSPPRESFYSSSYQVRYYANRHGDSCPEDSGYNAAKGKCELLKPAPCQSTGHELCPERLGKGPSDFCPSFFAGNPINFGNGNKFQKELDYQAISNSVLNFSRSYNSVDGLWRHSYSTHLRISQDARSIALVMFHGRESYFSVNDATIVSTSGEVGVLSKTDTGWLFISTSNERFTFDTAGKLTQWSNAQGALHQFAYTGNQLTVTDNLGNSLTVIEDADKKPLILTAPGLQITYDYNANKRLTSVIRTIGGQTTQRQFHYEVPGKPDLLTGITDERGVRYASWAYDDQGRAISSEHAGGADRVSVTYNGDGTVSVLNELGKVANYSFQNIKGVRRITAIHGEPSPNCPYSNSTFTYDGRGLLKTKTDNKGIVTTYDYNDRDLEVSRTEASGTAQARTVTTEWHPTLFLPLAVTEPDRITRYQYDAQGRQLSRTVENR